MRRLGKRGGGGLLAIVVTGMTLWGMGALSYAALPALLHSVLAARRLGRAMMMHPARHAPVHAS